MISGSSGDSFASVAASSTVRFSAASSSTLVDDDARRLPIVTVTVTVVLVTPPDVVMLASAKRVLPLHSLVMFTRVSTAAANDSTRSAMAFACSRDSSPGPSAEAWSIMWCASC